MERRHMETADLAANEHDSQEEKIDYGDRIHDLRTQQGWSQMELARRSGVSNRVISKIESGRSEPRLTTLRRLARAFNIPVDMMIREKRVLVGRRIEREKVT